MTMLQGVYLGVFWYLLEKKGLHVSWFLPLAAIFVLATFLVARHFSGNWLPESLETRRVFGPEIVAAIALVVIYPIHAVLTLFVSKILRLDDMHFLKRLLWRAIVFLIVIPITGWIVSILLMLLFVAGGLVYNFLH